MSGEENVLQSSSEHNSIPKCESCRSEPRLDEIWHLWLNSNTSQEDDDNDNDTLNADVSSMC